jgi:signal transduction histidine kinase
MGLPNEPVTLNAEQLSELNRKLSNMSHDIRNSLSLIVASAELIKARPELFEKMMPRIADAPAKIQAAVEKFRQEFERAVGITKP